MLDHLWKGWASDRDTRISQAASEQYGIRAGDRACPEGLRCMTVQKNAGYPRLFTVSSILVSVGPAKAFRHGNELKFCEKQNWALLEGCTATSKHTVSPDQRDSRALEVRMRSHRPYA